MVTVQEANSVVRQSQVANKGKAPLSSNSDYQTFLTMLTAQIKNQDPLNPMEGSDFAVQLATFSGVEQQVRTNEILSDLAQGLTATDLIRYSDWIGRSVQTSAAIPFSGDPVSLSFELEENADLNVITVIDVQGKEVDKWTVSEKAEEYQWNGVVSSGTPVPDGLYSFKINSYKNDELVASSPVYAGAKIAGIDISKSEASFLFVGGGSASVNELASVIDDGLQ